MFADGWVMDEANQEIGMLENIALQNSKYNQLKQSIMMQEICQKN